MNISEIIKAGIIKGSTNTEILAEVIAAHPAANTKAASVAWYRSQMKKGGAKVPRAPKTAKDLTRTAIAKAIAPQQYAYEVRGVKPRAGREGGGFNALLYCDGVKVAIVNDYGDGAGVDSEWLDLNDIAVVKGINIVQKPYSREGTAQEAKFASYLMSLPKRINPFDKTKTPRFIDAETFISNLVNDIELRKSLVRLTRGKVAFECEGKLYTTKIDPTPEAIDKLVAVQKKPVVVLNTLPEAEAIAILRKLQYA